jgi:hypothetical protein
MNKRSAGGGHSYMGMTNDFFKEKKEWSKIKDDIL